MSIPVTSFVVLGYVQAAHGLGGGVRIVFFNPDSDLPVTTDRLWLYRPPAGRFRDGGKGPLTYAELLRINETDLEMMQVVDAAPQTATVLYRFAGVADRRAAEALTGCQVMVPRAMLPPLPDGEHYLHDLLGMEAFDDLGASLGVVTAFDDNGAQDLLAITDSKGRQTLVPLVDSIVTLIDFETGRLVIDHALGLFDSGDDAAPTTPSS